MGNAGNGITRGKFLFFGDFFFPKGSSRIKNATDGKIIVINIYVLMFESVRTIQEKP